MDSLQPMSLVFPVQPVQESTRLLTEPLDDQATTPSSVIIVIGKEKIDRFSAQTISHFFNMTDLSDCKTHAIQSFIPWKRT